MQNRRKSEFNRPCQNSGFVCCLSLFSVVSVFWFDPAFLMRVILRLPMVARQSHQYLFCGLSFVNPLRKKCEPLRSLSPRLTTSSWLWITSPWLSQCCGQGSPAFRPRPYAQLPSPECVAESVRMWGPEDIGLPLPEEQPGEGASNGPPQHWRPQCYF